MKHIVAILVSLAVVCGGSAALAHGLAQASVTLPSPGLTPASPFYFLDRLGEAIQELFTFSAEGKVRLQIKFAAERVAEIKIMIETKGVEAPGLDVALQRLEEHKARAQQIIQKENLSIEVEHEFEELEEVDELRVAKAGREATRMAEETEGLKELEDLDLDLENDFKEIEELEKELAPKPQPVPPAPAPAPAPDAPQPTTKTFNIEADDAGLYPSEIKVKKGDQVIINFKVRSTGVYFAGLDFRGSPYFNTGKVSPGGSTTAQFTANESFEYRSYWPASNVLKAVGKVIVE